jgi:hypothetical protein
MPVFSKMMGSYPFNLIQGLGPRVKAAGIGAGVGGLYGSTGRRGSVGRAASYGMGGAVLGYAAMSGMPGLQQFGRNMMRPGNARMLGSSLASKGRSAWSSAAARIGRML